MKPTSSGKKRSEIQVGPNGEKLKRPESLKQGLVVADCLSINVFVGMRATFSGPTEFERYFFNTTEKICAMVRSRLQKRCGPTCAHNTKSALNRQPFNGRIEDYGDLC